MTPRRGDVYECPQCQLQVIVLSGGHMAPLEQSSKMLCSCGEKFVLVQSGSSSSERVNLSSIDSPVR
jgi:hypothetical protein